MSGSGKAQERPGQQASSNATADTTTFHARTQLILVPTVVKDRSGAHIPDLHAEDFTVYEDGKPQKIASFEEIKASNQKSLPHVSGEFTNFLPGDIAPRRLTIVLLDLLNTPFLGREYARQELLKAVSASTNSGDPIALFVLNGAGIRIIHDFTSDPATLAAALRTASVGTNDADPAGIDPSEFASDTVALSSLGGPPDGHFEAYQQRRLIDITLDSFQDLAKALEGIPGRKAVIWASGGFPFLSPGATSDAVMRSAYEKTWRLLNSANIAIYSVDVRGLFNPALSGGRLQNHQAGSITLASFSSETGGKSFIDSTNITGGFRAALDDSSSYYLLGYYLERGQAKPGWHKLEAKVAHSSAHVRARTGFLVSDSPGAPTNALHETEAATASPLTFTAVPMTVKLEPVTEIAGRKRVPFTVTVAADAFFIDEADNNHANLEITAVGLNPTGTTAAIKSQVINAHFKPDALAQIHEGGLVYRNILELAPGEYQGRFVVRDLLSGRIGSVHAPLKVTP